MSRVNPASWWAYDDAVEQWAEKEVERELAEMALEQLEEMEEEEEEEEEEGGSPLCHTSEADCSVLFARVSAARAVFLEGARSFLDSSVQEVQSLERVLLESRGEESPSSQSRAGHEERDEIKLHRELATPREPQYSDEEAPPTQLASEVMPTATPTTDIVTATPKADLPTATPKADLPTATPNTDLPTATPNTDLPIATPNTDLPTATPNTDLPTATPNTDLPTATPNTDLPTATPITDLPTATPNTDLPSSKSPAVSALSSVLCQEEEERLHVEVEQQWSFLQAFEEECHRLRQQEELMRVEMEQRAAAKRSWAATVLQSWWRGYRTRKMFVVMLQKRRAAEEKRVEEEKKRVEVEKKAAEEKKRAEEEKKKVEEERKRAEEEKKKVEEERKRAEVEKKAAEEKKKVEEERKRAEVEKKAAEEKKKVEEEKRAAEEKKKVEEEKRAAEEKKKVEEERKRAEVEKKSAEEKKRATEGKRAAADTGQLTTTTTSSVPSPSSGRFTLDRRLKSALDLLQRDQATRSGERTPISPLASSSDPLCAASCHRQASPTHSTAPHTGGRGLASGSAVEGRERIVMEPCSSAGEGSEEDRREVQCAGGNVEQSTTSLPSMVLSVSPEELPLKVWEELVMERRQQWVQGHDLWDAPPPPHKEKSAYPHLASRPVEPADNARPLSTIQLLASSARGTPLNKVVRVCVSVCCHPLDLRSLAVCPVLTSLHLDKCKGTVLCGLHGNKKIREIVAQDNDMTGLDLSELVNLSFLDLKGNRLPALAGLHHCGALLELAVDGNRLTRLTSLRACQSLQKLTADRNLLISSTGLRDLPSLQEVSLAENHLPKLAGHEFCVLLQSLNLQQNNIQEFPWLHNHVLLRELNLAENGLDNIGPIKLSWLPLLQKLNLSCNCITSLEPLTCCVSLEDLNVSNNYINDLPLLLQSLKGCVCLRTLSLHGNPISSAPKLKSCLLELLPRLCVLNEVELKDTAKDNRAIISHPLREMCARQIREQDLMKDRHRQELSSLEECCLTFPQEHTNELLRVKVFQADQYRQLLVQHLREHEYLGSERAWQLKEEDSRHALCEAALVLQKVWRGRQARRLARTLTPEWHAALLLQAMWRGVRARHTLGPHLTWLHKRKEDHQRRERAATVLQAAFRGYQLRKRLAALLQATQVDLFEDGFVFPEDTEQLQADILESAVDDEWRPLATPIPAPDPVDPPTTSRTGKPPPLVPQFGLPGMVDQEVCYEEWRAGRTGPAGVQLQSDVVMAPVVATKSLVATGESQESQGSQELPDDEPVSHGQSHDQSPRRSQAAKTDVSGWHFTDPRTADLMKKKVMRQKRLQDKSSQKRKMADPSVRLALFKKHQHKREEEGEGSRVRPTALRRPAQQARECLAFGGGESTRSTPTPDPTQVANKRDYVFEWVQRQRAAREDTVDRMWNAKAAARVLPPMDPQVLAGHKPQLVTVAVQSRVEREVATQRRRQSSDLRTEEAAAPRTK